MAIAVPEGEQGAEYVATVAEKYWKRTREVVVEAAVVSEAAPQFRTSVVARRLLHRDQLLSTRSSKAPPNSSGLH